MTVVVIIETVVLAIALVFLVALLRSHAEILRRLAAVEGPPTAADPTAAINELRDQPTVGAVVGQTLAGDAIKLSLSGGRHGDRTLLAFLSSGCTSCGPLWEGLRAGRPVPPGIRLIVVTKGEDRESPTRLDRLAHDPREVVMSSPAWDDFAIPATPHFVLVGGEDGRVLGRGSANSWEQITGLLLDADADSGRATQSEARTSSQRAARAEAALAAAGIGEGHPSLHPSRDDPGEPA